MQPWRVQRSKPWRLAAAVALGLGVAAVATTPAQAAITSLSPSSATIDPGGGASSTVRVQASGLTCINLSSSSSAVTVDVTPKCSDASSWTAQLSISTDGAIAPGTYSVRVTDQQSGEGSGQTFTLRVREPPPPATTTVPPTTTTPPPTTTTTAKATTTTSTTAPASTTAPTSTTAPATSTTFAPPPPGGGFVDVAAAVDAGVPEEGVFLPLVGDSYRDCLPLTAACVNPESALVLVPARTTEVRWQPLGADERSAPRVELRGLRPLSPVGLPPADPGAQDYAVPILDLSAPGGQVRTLVRGLDEQGQLVTARVHEQPALASPSAEGPQAQPEAATFLASAPFGRPQLLTKGQLSEASPAIALFSSTRLQVLYAVRPDPRWGLNVALLPLLTHDSVPYLVRGVDGPPGLFLARPAGLRVPQAGSLDDPTTTAAADDDGGGGSPVLLLLGGAVAIGAVATFVLARRRGRGLSRPRGTSR